MTTPNITKEEQPECHSKKPIEVMKRIVELCGNISRVELFSRQKQDGWDAWGNEVDSDITLNADKTSNKEKLTDKDWDKVEQRLKEGAVPTIGACNAEKSQNEKETNNTHRKPRSTNHDNHTGMNSCETFSVDNTELKGK